jgi:hypothetical protein
MASSSFLERVMGIDKFVWNEFGRMKCARQGGVQGRTPTAHVILYS